MYNILYYDYYYYYYRCRCSILRAPATANRVRMHTRPKYLNVARAARPRRTTMSTVYNVRSVARGHRHPSIIHRFGR